MRSSVVGIKKLGKREVKKLLRRDEERPTPLEEVRSILNRSDIGEGVVVSLPTARGNKKFCDMTYHIHGRGWKTSHRSLDNSGRKWAFIKVER